MQRKNAVFTFISEPQPILDEVKDSARRENNFQFSIVNYQLSIDIGIHFSLFTFDFRLSIEKQLSIINCQLSIEFDCPLPKASKRPLPSVTEGEAKRNLRWSPLAEESRPRRGRHTRESAILNYQLSIEFDCQLSIINCQLKNDCPLSKASKRPLPSVTEGEAKRNLRWSPSRKKAGLEEIAIPESLQFSIVNCPLKKFPAPQRPYRGKCLILQIAAGEEKASPAFRNRPQRLRNVIP